MPSADSSLSTDRVFGLLNIHKPAGWTSRDVVNRVQGMVRPAKAGHAGTLDPMATGVLVVCIGRATRLVPLIQEQRKVYRATFLLGRTSESHDLETPLERMPEASIVTPDDVLRLLPEFLGRIEQTPPLHSAVKVRGQRAYKLARRGKTAELAPREIEIHRLDLLEFASDRIRLEVECGSGTYIRSLARDLGARLGCGAVMSELIRTRIGDFDLDEAVDVARLERDSLTSQLIPAARAVSHLPQMRIDAAEAGALAYGRPLAFPSARPEGDLVAVVDSRGELLALGSCRDGMLQPAQVFITPEDLRAKEG